MTNEAELDLIKRSIREAFADTPHPDLSTIHPLGCCEEHEQDFEWYRSHTWQEFKEFLPSGRFDPFEFFALHPVAYHYFVPGILLAALETPSWDEDAWVNNLLPYEDRAPYFRSDYLPLFTPRQRQAVVSYLRCWFDEWRTELRGPEEMVGRITYDDSGWEVRHGEVTEDDLNYIKRVESAINEIWPDET